MWLVTWLRKEAESEPIPVLAGVLVVALHAAILATLVISMKIKPADHSRATVKLWGSLPISRAQDTPPPKASTRKQSPLKEQEIAPPPVRPDITAPAPKAVQRPPANFSSPAPPAMTSPTLPSPTPPPRAIETASLPAPVPPVAPAPSPARPTQTPSVARVAEPLAAPRPLTPPAAETPLPATLPAPASPSPASRPTQSTSPRQAEQPLAEARPLAPRPAENSVAPPVANTAPVAPSPSLRSSQAPPAARSLEPVAEPAPRAPAPRAAEPPPPPPPAPAVDREAQRREKALALAEVLRQEEDTPGTEVLDSERQERRVEAENRRLERERDLARKLREEAEAADRARAEEQSGRAANAQTLALIDEYRARISAKVRQRLVMPPDLGGNPEAHFEVSLLAGGDVVQVRLRKSSGIATLDAAVERAIRAAQPLPVPDDPELFHVHFRNFLLNFRPRE